MPATIQTSLTLCLCRLYGQKCARIQAHRRVCQQATRSLYKSVTQTLVGVCCLQIFYSLFPEDCWTLRSVATGWAAAVRSGRDIQLTIPSDSLRLKSKFALAKDLQSRYVDTQFVVKVTTPLKPLACINLLRATKYQVRYCICTKHQLAPGWQQSICCRVCNLPAAICCLSWTLLSTI